VDQWPATLNDYRRSQITTALHSEPEAMNSIQTGTQKAIERTQNEVVRDDHEIGKRTIFRKVKVIS